MMRNCVSRVQRRPLRSHEGNFPRQMNAWTSLSSVTWGASDEPQDDDLDYDLPPMLLLLPCCRALLRLLTVNPERETERKVIGMEIITKSATLEHTTTGHMALEQIKICMI